MVHIRRLQGKIVTYETCEGEDGEGKLLARIGNDALIEVSPGEAIRVPFETVELKND